MKQINWKEMTVEEIGALVCSHLEKQKISVVLVGGACVTIYSENQYKSADLDFVMGDYSLKELDPIMAEIDLKRGLSTMRHYENKDCPYFIEFPPAPLTVGDEFITKTETIKTKYGILRLLTPEDSVKDRLAAFYHWGDRQSLEQAILICHTRKINLEEVKRWSEKEGASEKYQYFVKALKRK